jgi:hypothetical protein
MENRKRKEENNNNNPNGNNDSPKKIKVEEKKLDLKELQRKKDLLAKKKEALVQKKKVMDEILKSGVKKGIKNEPLDITSSITPPPLILDDKGNALIDIKNLKKNVTKFLKKPPKKFHLGAEKINIQAIKGSKTYDPRVSIPNYERKKRSLNFLAPGMLTKKSQQSQDKIQAQLFEKEMEEGVDVIIKPEYLHLVNKSKSVDEIPNIEWWDTFIGLENSYEGWKNKVKKFKKKILENKKKEKTNIKNKNKNKKKK